MRDDRLPIMRIFTALFFIETDYIATVLYPHFLDFKRCWILSFAAFRHTLKPACIFIDVQIYLKACQPPTISTTGSMQDSGEKSIRLAKSSSSILRHRQALWTRSQQVRNSSP